MHTRATVAGAAIIEHVDAPRVLAVDDQAPYLVVMRRVVDAAPGFEFAAEADSGELAIESACALHPEIVLMDVDMPGVGGIEAAKRIKDALPATVVVLVSATHPDDLSREVSSCRADAVVWKPDLRPALLEQVWRARGASEAAAAER